MTKKSLPIKTQEGIEYRIGGYIFGKLHREDGPAIIRDNGDLMWYVNDIPHREDGPAFLFSHGGEWWLNQGCLHRVDGPAKTDCNGREEWHIDGCQINPLEEEIAKGILSGELFDKIPLYMNHYRLKYFCQVVFEKGPIHA